MKKIIGSIIFLIAFAFGADVKPFVFENVTEDDSVAQQAEFDYMLKYKLFGRDYLTMGRRVIIPDKSGWNGTANNITSAEQISLGGATLAGGSISLGDGCKLTTGPIRATSLTAGNDNQQHLFGGHICLENTNISNAVQTGMTRAGGELNCDDVPAAPVNLSIPTITWPDTGYIDDIIVNGNNGDASSVAYIEVPEGEGTYDVYVDKIHLNYGTGKDGAKLYIRMPDGGRLTRIFVKDLKIGNHTTLNVVYRTEEGDEIQSQSQYRGNVMFYSNNDITFTNTDNVPIQGSYITTGKISLNCNLDFSGQLLANQLYIGDDFKGENFKFVPFDPPVIDIPELDKDGGLRENDSTVVIPLSLDTAGSVDVYFSYCFDLKDGVDSSDFNLVTDFPVCGISTKTVIIKEGSLTPTEPITINVKKDTLIEPNEYLVMKISIESGAVLPNNKTDGYLKIKIIDATISPIAFDTTAVYIFDENKTDVVDLIKILNKTDSTKFYLDSAYTGRYTLDSLTGELTLVTNPLDYETTQIDTIKVTVKDTGNVSITGYIPIRVTDINEAPTVKDATIKVPENTPTNTVVGKIDATDPDILNPVYSTLTYTILENVPFKVDNTGKIIVKDGSKLNYEKTPSYIFKVVVSDGTYKDTATVKINIEDVNEPPYIIDDGIKNYDVNENEGLGYEIASIKIVDEDGVLTGDKIQVKTTTGGDSIFYPHRFVHGDTLELIFMVSKPQNLDYEKVTTVQKYTIIANDGEYVDSIQKTITIKDVNETPVLNDTTITLLENLPIPSIVGTLKATDPDTKNSAFRNNLYQIIGTDSIFTIDNSGRITASKIFNYETDDTVYTLKVRVYDKNDPTLCDTATVTIKIGNTNEGPKFPTKDTTFFVDENKKAGTIGNIAATDEDGDKITYKVIGSVPFTVDSLGNVKSTRAFDYEKETGFTFKVVATSTGNLTDTIKVNVKVNNVNEPCEVRDTTFSIKENATGKIGNVNATDLDKDALFGTITYSISDPTHYQIDKDGNVFVKTPFNYEDTKVDSIKVYITDGTNKDTAIIKINVINVPEDITLSGKVDPVEENVEIGTPVGIITGVDGDSTVITYSINTSDFKIDPTTGVITTNSVIDYETQKEYTVTVTAKSTDGSKKDTTFTIKVLNVNEPVHINDTTLTVPENYTGPIGEVEGKDDDGEPVKYSVRDSVNYSVDSLGVITIKKPLDYEKQKTDTLIVDVTTPSGDKDSAIVIINVKNVNETPELQPNDTLKVPENCKNCEVGKIVAIDPDNDPITYTVKEPGFTIDSTGTLKVTDPLDYEKTPIVTITVIAKDPSGAGDTATYTIKVTDVNEPVHTKDTKCEVKENYTGNVCKIPGTDDDGKKPTWIVTDTTNYSIDTTGQLVIKNPIDYEKKTKDTIQVIVTDGEFYDTATVIINVIDEDEKPTITKIDDQPKVDTLKTNDPNHNIVFNVCEGLKCYVDSLDVEVHKDTTIKVCNVKKTLCDSVVILFNDAPPIVTLKNATSTKADINYITIEEETKDNKIYLNKKDNEITVLVKDTVNKTETKFNIDVKLDTLPSKDIKLKDYTYVIDETKATVKPIGDNKAEITEIIKENGEEIVITQIIDIKTGKPIDDTQTVTYTKKVNGKDVVVTYKTDNLTGQRVSDYEVSYMVDSCTKVTYTMNDKKQIVKNNEGNIGYKVTYDYVDDFGNKASASVEIVYDDIPPVVEILEPIKGDIFKTNAIEVKWTVNGIVQDTLTLQRLEKGPNIIVRRYVDKAGNEAIDTVVVMMKEAKDIDITIIHPVTEINQDKVDEFYGNGEKYNPKKPYKVKIVDPKSDSLPETIGVGFKIDIALPSVSAIGGLATLDDLLNNGQIPVDEKGNIVGASTLGIPVEKYVEEHCNEEFQEEYRKNGTNIPLYDVTYYLHLWVWTTTASYVNDFNVEYTLNDQSVPTEAGTVQMVIDWLADKNGSVNAENGKALGTGSYITKLYSKSVAKHRCDYKDQVKGDKTVKKEENMKTFGYKRPTKK